MTLAWQSQGFSRVAIRGLILLLGLLKIDGLLAQQILVLKDKHIAEPVGQFISSVVVPGDTNDFTEIDKSRLNLQPNTTDYFDAGFIDGRAFLLLNIQNNSPDTRRIYLELRDVFVPFIRLTEEGSGYSQLATLDSFQGAFDRKYHLHVFQMDVKPGLNKYWVEIRGFPKRLKLYLWDQESFLDRGLHEHSLLMMSMAFPLVLVFYELLLFFTTRDRLRLVYIAALSSVWASSFISIGMISMVVPSSALAWIYTKGIYSTYLLASTLVPHFIIKLFKPIQRPQLKAVYLVWVLINCATLFLIQFVPFNKNFIYIVLSPLIANTIAIVAIASGIRQGHRHAYYLVLGAAPGIVANLYDIALLYFEWPLFAFQELAVPVGLTTFAMGLSMAVGKDIQLREKAAAKQIDALNRDLRVHILSIEDIVAAKTAKIKSIMENIKQGIFTINKNREIDPEHSAFLEKILESSHIGAMDPIGLLFEGTEDKQDEMDKIRSAILIILDEPKIAFDLNQSVFPTEITRQLPSGETQILECEWSPILDSQGLTDRILVCVRDVTATRKLVTQNARQTENTQILSELLGVEPMLFQRFMQQGYSYVAQVESYCQPRKDGQSSPLNEILISTHTLKGLARSLNLGIITEVIHRIETELKNATEIPPSFSALQNLLESYRQLSDSLHTTHRAAIQSQQQRAEMEKILQNFARLPAPFTATESQAYDAVKRSLEGLCLVSMAGLIEEAQAGAKRLARDLQKAEPAFEVYGEPLLLTPQQDVTLRNIFLHLIRNAMDHGIETPDVRRLKGKNPVGRLELRIKDEQDSIMIEFCDDGQGLQVNRLLQGAITQGILDPGSQLTRAEIAELMFLPGLSTAETISDISGRGIGMFAVRKMIEEIGGRITIALVPSATESSPFVFRIELPRLSMPRLEQAA